MAELTRRSFTLSALGASAFAQRPQAARAKSLLVLGGGIAGLSCAYELMTRGHDVKVLEAAARTGGHVLTLRTPFDEGLYADAGAEHGTRPGYDLFWGYLREFGLEALPYPRRDRIITISGGKRYTDEQLQDRALLAKMGYSQREVEYMARNGWHELSGLFFERYTDKIRDEYQPFGVGLDDLDNLTPTDLLKREKASPAAIARFGGSSSALHGIWHEAIQRRRGVPMFPRDVRRVKGGNQTLTDTFAARLGARITMGCRVTKIEARGDGVQVTYTHNGETKTAQAEHAVSAMSAVALRGVAFEPALPPAKAWVIDNMPYYSESRVMVQCSRRFWKDADQCVNIVADNPKLNQVWAMADEVNTERGMLVGTAQGIGREDFVRASLEDYLPGSTKLAEKIVIQAWPKDPLASACEVINYRPGELRKFWPQSITAVGRIHFVGAYCDNLNWGMEAGTRSANRVAKQIHEA
jgi:monoamine oxidase